MSKRRPPLEGFKARWNAVLDRIGWSRRKHLEWVVRAVQAGRSSMTPADWDNLGREVTVFAGRGGSIDFIDIDSEIRATPPTVVRDILSELDQMLTAAVERQPVPLERAITFRRLIWNERTGRFQLMTQAQDEGDARVATRLYLGRLLEDYGHLVRQCPVPAPRKKGAKCGTLFVASRPRQEFCSSRCQSRSAQQKFRQKRRKTKARKKGA